MSPSPLGHTAAPLLRATAARTTASCTTAARTTIARATGLPDVVPARIASAAAVAGAAAVTAVTALIALTVLTALPAAAQEQAPPCEAPEHRQFDFWVGAWDVYRPDGQKAGHNEITVEMNGCVLHESYDGGGGYHGESFNVYDARRDVWHQTWVDNGGLLLRIEGGLRRGAMVLQGETVGADGSVTLQRITWSVLEGGRDRPSRVRQLWESSSDGGETWQVTFDGEYRRVGGDGGR